ncbi:MAG TPA: hypothetical protein VIK54_14030 [Acidimicrobiia bacterium]
MLDAVLFDAVLFDAAVSSGLEKGCRGVTWSLAILGFFVHIDAQKDPLQALLAAGVVAAVLWFVVAQARRREERRMQSRRDGTDRRPRDW